MAQPGFELGTVFFFHFYTCIYVCMYVMTLNDYSFNDIETTSEKGTVKFTLYLDNGGKYVYRVELC